MPFQDIQFHIGLSVLEMESCQSIGFSMGSVEEGLMYNTPEGDIARPREFVQPQ